MREKKLFIKALICMALLCAVTGLQTNAGKEDKLGTFLEKAAEAVRENYTLAELLKIGQETSVKLASVPERINEKVIDVNEEGLYGEPMDPAAEDESGLTPVYAAAGGRVLRCGLDQSLGLYVVIEHPDSGYGKGKISTYGNLSDIRVVSGERVTKGELIGTFRPRGEKDFYYALEKKS